MQHRPARLAALLLLLCCALPAPAQAPAPGAKPAKPPKEKGPTTIEADSLEGISDLEVTARGRVEFKRDDLTIYSQFLRYNQEFGRVEAHGGVRLTRGLDRFFGPDLRYDTRDDTGVFEGVNYILTGELSEMRGKADRLEFLGKDRFRLVNGTFTTCRPSHEDWRFKAREFDMDQNKEVATVRGARFEFFDTTLMALPYASFSLDKQRKSGFLAPYYSHNTRRGLEVGIPYYWNIAPEQDLTVTPSVMSKRGEEVKTDYRYLGATYKGELRYELLPHDKILDTSRSAITFEHQQQITPQLFGRLNINAVSDPRYFVDLSSQVRQVSQGILPREGYLQYNGTVGTTGYYVQTLVQHYQTLQDPLAPITPPYDRLPQVDFGTSRADIAGLFDLTLPGQWVRFSHPTLVEGTRVSLNPTLSTPLLAPSYFVTPKIGLHYASYGLQRTLAGQPDRQTEAVPWGSLDAGLVFDRSASWFGRSVTQTLEPRLFYVYAPYHNQDLIPVFDTGLADFNYAQLFTENRFAGGDRFGDASQLTMAATTRVLTPNGTELLRATLGQIYYFADERVGLTPTSTLRTRNQSDILASVGGHVAQSWTFDTTVQYNPEAATVQRGGASLRYAPEIAKVVNASYRYNRDPTLPLRQVDISGQWPVKPGWYAIGRYNYSFLDKRLLEGLAGVEYNAGCWVFRAAFQRLQAATQTASTGIFFQLEFNGVGSLGSDEILTMLKRSVPGYAVTNPTQGNLVPPSLQRPLPFEQIF